MVTALDMCILRGYAGPRGSARAPSGSERFPEEPSYSFAPPLENSSRQGACQSLLLGLPSTLLPFLYCSAPRAQAGKGNGSVADNGGAGTAAAGHRRVVISTSVWAGITFLAGCFCIVMTWKVSGQKRVAPCPCSRAREI